MSGWKRVARGVLGLGVIFATAGFFLFAILTAAAAALGRLEEEDPFFGIVAGTVWGFGIGVTFSAVLAATGSRFVFEKLSISRVAIMGALGGFLLAILLISGTKLAGNEFTGVTEALIFLPLLGAIAGSTSLVIARKADEPSS